MGGLDGDVEKPDKTWLSRESQLVDSRKGGERRKKKTQDQSAFMTEGNIYFTCLSKQAKKKSNCGDIELTCTNGRIINGATQREIRVVVQTDKQTK